jgi:activator of HSP90 ATPase
LKTKTTTIEQEARIHAAPDEVFEALADPAKHAVVTGAAATGKAKVGGKFTAWDGYIKGEFLEIAKGKRLVWAWETTEWPKGYPPSKVELTFEGTEAGTKLRMVQTGVPAEQAEEYRQGWIDYYWEPLKKHFSKK